MSETSKLVPVLGFAALAVFAAMAAILQIFVAPEVGFLPQAEIGRYADTDLVQIGADLRSAGLAGLYWAILFVVDSVFLILFFLFVLFGHLVWAMGVQRWIGPLVAAVTVAIDLAENMMLGGRMGLVGVGASDLASLRDAVSLVHWVTLAKFAGFAASIVLLFGLRRRA